MTKWKGFCLLFLAGCANVVSGPEVGKSASDLERADQAQGQGLSGVQLFDHETFDGNGRACVTCHLPESGAIGPEDIQAEFASNPNGPLFRAVDSDTGAGLSYNRLLERATFNVTIDLPDNVVLANDPSAREITLARGASTTLNIPGFEDEFMQDGRNSTLQEQALGAVRAHYDAGREPTDAELDKIAEFQLNNPDFYSSPEMLAWSNGGPAVDLPLGTTAEEQRGRVFFEPIADGICAHCHGGPFLNTVNEFILAPIPAGTRFFTAFVSDFNVAGNEVFTFEFYDPADPSAPPTIVESPDPGRALITGNPADVNLFRIPTVWGSVDTAPYFHDNSAADLEALMDHYQAYFAGVGILLTEQDKTDIIAYMHLLK